LKAQKFLEALRLVRAGASARFNESVDMMVQLNVDTKRSDERVRGRATLPHGVGRSLRLAVFARGEKADEARAAGADVVGGEDLVAEVLKGKIDFARCLATPDMMPALARAARTLGPKGLMPNPKRGSVVTDVTEAVLRAKGGEIEFKADMHGVVSASIGRVNFVPATLCDNGLSFLKEVLAARPQRFRSKPPKSISIKSTMGPAVMLDHRVLGAGDRRYF